VEESEVTYGLTPTGRNVSNEIRPANDPMLKVFKNRQLEAEYHHQKNLSEAIKQDTSIGNIKRKSYDLLMEDTYQNKAELAEKQAYQATQQTIDEKSQINNELETIKNNIFTIYKESKDEADFIKNIESQDISIELLKHSKTGTNKGLVFHHKGQSISGGKISNSMTLGKIKKRFPNFVHSLEKPPVLHSTHKLQSKILDFNIEQINKYYKQRKNNNNNDILIYFGKKNVEARPYNYNLKLSSNRDSIRFGPATPNDHDLTLCIDVALENGWQGATLSNSSPEFLKRMMKAAYKKDPELLFFVKSDKPNQLTYADLAEIKGNLTFDELITAIRNDLVVESDYLMLVDAMQELAKTAEEIALFKALKRGCPITEVDKKTFKELQTFNRHNSSEPNKNKAKIIPKKIENILEEGRESVQAEIQKEIEEMEMPRKDLLEEAGYKAKNRIS
jgi:hypothetical protein